MQWGVGPVLRGRVSNPPSSWQVVVGARCNVPIIQFKQDSSSPLGRLRMTLGIKSLVLSVSIRGCLSTTLYQNPGKKKEARNPVPLARKKTTSHRLEPGCIRGGNRTCGRNTSRRGKSPSRGSTVDCTGDAGRAGGSQSNTLLINLSNNGCRSV